MRLLIAFLFPVLLSTAGCATDGKNETRASADLIIYGDYLLNMTGDEPLRNQAVVVREGAIIAIGAASDIDARYSGDEIISGRNRVLMPGLVNGHTHAAMTLLRGVADDLALIEWLNDFIFPTEIELVDEAFIRTGTLLACREMIRGGTTALVDMYFFPDTVAQAFIDCGLRAVVLPSVIEQPSPDAADFDQSLRQAVDFAERWRNRHARIVPGIAAHSVYTISEPALKTLAQAAASHSLPVSIHVSESEYEMAVTAERHARTPVQLLEDLGFMQNTLIAAHVVHATPDDIEILARRGVGVIHNPTSNAKLASGIAPVGQMISAGVTVGLGSDGAASNNDLDLWEEIRLASLLAKVSSMDPTTLPAMRALELATRDGARAIGLQQQIGTIEIGKRADLIQVALDDLDFAPIYDVVSHLVYVTDAEDVVTTIVDGQVLMREGEITSIDEQALRRDVDNQRRRISALVRPDDQAALKQASP